MFPFGEIIPLMLARFVGVLFNPLFWVVVLLVGLQYRRMESMREIMFGFPKGRAWPHALMAVGFGLIGGLVGSMIMIFIGLTLTGSGLIYLWVVAIVLMFINARFLCFAYAGGIVALSNLIFGFPQVHIPQLLALVAILHMVESFLILWSGHLAAVPAYFKHPGGKVVGGYTLQKFWPIPLVALMVTVGPALPETGVNMPDWWPMIKPALDVDPSKLSYLLIPVVAGLGYGDLAVARNPREKSRLSALFLAGYSVVLLALALASAQSQFLLVVAILFSPLGHELIIYLGKQVEFNAKPIYVPRWEGLAMLDVYPDSPAWRAGLRSGDVVISVSGVPVNRAEHLVAAMELAGTWPVEMVYLSGEPPRYRRELLSTTGGVRGLGLLPVPQGDEEHYTDLNTASPLARWWRSKMGPKSGP